MAGGPDNLTLVTLDQVATHEDVDVDRLFSLDALRPATPDEVELWKSQQPAGDEDDAEELPTEETFSRPMTRQQAASNPPATTGNQTLEQAAGEPAANTGASESNAPAPAAAPVADEGSKQDTRTKGELSELTVADLRTMAKDKGISGYTQMNKDELLNALTA
jgi:hypothetical protein